MIQYYLHFTPGYPYLAVDMVVKQFDAALFSSKPLETQLASWAPGSYKNRYFPGFVSDVKAWSIDNSGEIINPVNVKKIDVSTWQFASHKGNQLKINYRIYAQDRSVRSAYIGRDYAFFNGPAIFMKVNGLDNVPTTVWLNQPDTNANWQLVSRHQIEQTRPYFSASSYRDVIEHPIIWSKEVVTDAFSIPGASEIKVSVFGHAKWLKDLDMAELTDSVKKICLSHIKLFGTWPLAEPYHFMLFATESDYGGLEHLTNNFSICRYKQLPKKGQKQKSNEYIDLLGLLAHELFHNPWVTRIKPLAFKQYDPTAIPDTALLWLFEGATRYYELKLLMDVISEDAYLHHLAWLLTAYTRWPGRYIESLATSAVNAPIKFYQPGAHTTNDTVSYYSQGGVFILWLDQTIRLLTKNHFSMDDVIKRIASDFQQHGQLVTDNLSVQRLIETHCQLEQGQLDSVFEQGLYGIGDYPVDKILQYFGLQLKYRARASKDDSGGQLEAGQSVLTKDMGIRVGKHDKGVFIQYVGPGSSAERAGLLPGDVIKAIQSGKDIFDNLTEENFESIIENFAIGAAIELTVLGVDKEPETIFVTVVERVLDTCELLIDKKASVEYHNNRAAWLGIS